MASLYKRVVRGEMRPIPMQYSDELRFIINSMLTVRPKDRVSLCKSILMTYMSKLIKFIMLEDLLQMRLI